MKAITRFSLVLGMFFCASAAFADDHCYKVNYNPITGKITVVEIKCPQP